MILRTQCSGITCERAEGMLGQTWVRSMLGLHHCNIFSAICFSLLIFLETWEPWYRSITANIFGNFFIWKYESFDFISLVWGHIWHCLGAPPDPMIRGHKGYLHECWVLYANALVLSDLVIPTSTHRNIPKNDPGTYPSEDTGCLLVFLV